MNISDGKAQTFFNQRLARSSSHAACVIRNTGRGQARDTRGMFSNIIVILARNTEVRDPRRTQPARHGAAATPMRPDSAAFAHLR